MTDSGGPTAPGGIDDRWRGITGIPVEASFLRTYQVLGGPAQLGYPITPGLFLADALVQYFNHARLEVPGRSSHHPLGVPRLADLGSIMARAVLGDAVRPPATPPAGAFADPWYDPGRRERAGQAATAPVDWRGVWTQWYEREVVRLMPVSPGSARPVPGNLGDLYVSLSDAERQRGEGRESPLDRPRTEGASPVIAPVLTYHLTRDPAPFREQLQALMAAGLTPISMDQLVAGIEGWAAVPERPVVVTLDDGWADQLSGALPVLVELRVPAAFFLLPGFDRHGQGHMSIEEFRQVRAAGMTIGSHTLNHADLPALIASDLGAAQAEVVESRRILEREVDGVDYLAYPEGRFDAETLQLVREVGYRAAVTTLPGIVHRRERLFTLRRVGVQAWWSFEEVCAAIRAAAQADGVPSPV